MMLFLFLGDLLVIVVFMCRDGMRKHGMLRDVENSGSMSMHTSDEDW